MPVSAVTDPATPCSRDLLLMIPDKFRTSKGIFALIISLVTGYLTLSLFSSAVQMAVFDEAVGRSCIALFGTNLLQGSDRYLTFTLDNLSKLIILFISLFTILILIYSLVYIKAGKARKLLSMVSDNSWLFLWSSLV